MTVYEKALAAIRREQMLPAGSSVTVGLSGGADSVTLLHLLLSLRKELSLDRITAVHIDHGLRGEEAVRDRCFVEELCARWQVPLAVHTYDVAALAEEQRLGVEEAGREVRYHCFEAEADRIDGLIATAHTASDNAETLLLHLCRGSGLHGLCGIPPRRGRVIRPLIDCTRDEIEMYCAEHGLSYMTDSTNSDMAYARNRIRQAVMPQLKEINPQAEEAIRRLIASAREWEDYTQQRAGELLAQALVEKNTYRRDVLVSAEPMLLSAALHRLIGENGRQRGSEHHIREAVSLLEHGGRLSLPGDRLMTVTEKYVCFSSAEIAKAFCFEGVQPTQTYAIAGNMWRLMCVSCENYEQKQNISKLVFSNACDYDKIVGSLCLRQRLPGDEYHPLGRGCGKTLKKLFNEAALPAAQRASLPILCDEKGIVLVPGFGCDERVGVTEKTETVLILGMMEEV